MTWSEIKLATLQKMFAADGTTIVNNESTEGYLAGMAQVCNEALHSLATAGKFIVKKFQIANNPIDNLLADAESKVIIQILETEEFTASSGKSYSFAFTGEGVLTITVGETPVEIALPNTTYYKTYAGLISNVDDEEVTFSFEPTYPSAIKDFGVYNVSFSSTDEIPSFGEMVKYDLAEEVDDFFQLAPQDIIFEGSSQDSRYIQTSSFFQEGNSIFVIERKLAGNYTIYYKAYPGTITQDTADDYELPLDPEVAVLLPLYMASQLYKDDSLALATTYRNEFEVGRSELKPKPKAPVAEKFISESGWI